MHEVPMRARRNRRLRTVRLFRLAFFIVVAVLAATVLLPAELNPVRALDDEPEVTAEASAGAEPSAGPDEETAVEETAVEETAVEETADEESGPEVSGQGSDDPEDDGEVGQEAGD